MTYGARAKMSDPAMKEVEAALERYIQECRIARENGHLAWTTYTTYTGHSVNFVRWLRGDFEPGIRNKGSGGISSRESAIRAKVENPPPLPPPKTYTPIAC